MPQVTARRTLRPAPLPRVGDYLWADHDIGGEPRTDSQALTDATRFRLIVTRPWRGYTTSQVTRMRTANPRLVVLVYLNATFEAATLDPHHTLHPPDWYATTSSGQRLVSTGYGNPLMNPTHPGWMRNRAAEATRVADTLNAHGVFLDMLTNAPLQPGYLTTGDGAPGIPADPATGHPHTSATWYAAADTLAEHIRTTSGLQVAGNSLGRWGDWPAAAAHYRDTTLGWQLAENWLRGARAAPTVYPTTAQWVEAVDQVAHPDKGDTRFLGMNKLWTSATAAQQQAWDEYTVATLACGWTTPGDAVTTYPSDTADPMAWNPWYDTPVGWPTGPLTHHNPGGHLHTRRLTHGLAAVNTTAAATILTLPPGRWTRATTGTVHTGSTPMPGHTGHIYWETR